MITLLPCMLLLLLLLMMLKELVMLVFCEFLGRLAAWVECKLPCGVGGILAVGFVAVGFAVGWAGL